MVIDHGDQTTPAPWSLSIARKKEFDRLGLISDASDLILPLLVADTPSRCVILNPDGTAPRTAPFYKLSRYSVTLISSSSQSVGQICGYHAAKNRLVTWTADGPGDGVVGYPLPASATPVVVSSSTSAVVAITTAGDIIIYQTDDHAAPPHTLPGALSPTSAGQTPMACIRTGMDSVTIAAVTNTNTKSSNHHIEGNKGQRGPVLTSIVINIPHTPTPTPAYAFTKRVSLLTAALGVPVGIDIAHSGHQIAIVSQTHVAVVPVAVPQGSKIYRITRYEDEVIKSIKWDVPHRPEASVFPAGIITSSIGIRQFSCSGISDSLVEILDAKDVIASGRHCLVLVGGEIQHIPWKTVQHQSTNLVFASPNLTSTVDSPLSQWVESAVDQVTSCPTPPVLQHRGTPPQVSSPVLRGLGELAPAALLRVARSLPSTHPKTGSVVQYVLKGGYVPAPPAPPPPPADSVPLLRGDLKAAVRACISSLSRPDPHPTQPPKHSGALRALAAITAILGNYPAMWSIALQQGTAGSGDIIRQVLLTSLQLFNQQPTVTVSPFCSRLVSVPAYPTDKTQLESAVMGLLDLLPLSYQQLVRGWFDVSPARVNLKILDHIRDNGCTPLLKAFGGLGAVNLVGPKSLAVPPIQPSELVSLFSHLLENSHWASIYRFLSYPLADRSVSIILATTAAYTQRLAASLPASSARISRVFTLYFKVLFSGHPTRPDPATRVDFVYPDCIFTQGATTWHVGEHRHLTRLTCRALWASFLIEVIENIDSEKQLRWLARIHALGDLVQLDVTPRLKRCLVALSTGETTMTVKRARSAARYLKARPADPALVKIAAAMLISTSNATVNSTDKYASLRILCKAISAPPAAPSEWMWVHEDDGLFMTNIVGEAVGRFVSSG